MSRKANVSAGAALAVSQLLIAEVAEGLEISFLARRDFVVGQGPRSVAVGDFNGDGLTDLATGNCSRNSVSVLLGNGDGTFQTPRIFGAEFRSFPAVAVEDFNGDGVPDLAATNFSSVSVLINTTRH
jgi:hypothetical protein